MRDLSISNILQTNKGISWRGVSACAHQISPVIDVNDAAKLVLAVSAKMHLFIESNFRKYYEWIVSTCSDTEI